MSRSRLRTSVSIAGGPACAAALTGVRDAVRNRVLRQAAAKQARRGVKVAKGLLAAGRTGQLKRAVGFVYRSYRRRTLWVYIVGPRNGYRVSLAALPPAARKRLERYLGRRRRRALNGPRAVAMLKGAIDPSYYAHLVEGGRKAVRPKKASVLSGGGVVYGRHAAAVGARPFVRPAADAVRGAGAEFAADVQDGVTREARRAARGATR